MPKKIAGWLLILACALAFAGCKGGAAVGNSASSEQRGEADVDAVLSEIDSFTGELLKRIEAARDPVSGVTEAQKFLDERKADLHAKIASVKRSRKFRESDDVRKRALESEVDNVMRVSGVRTKHMGDAMNDPAFGAKLDRLINDYQELFKE
ncbi:MAG TPA: hypothetical protein VM934_01145 [Pyrinomonadaceae bacterium]|jgi:hypothetical protein|nr:hypothetical protein [Pyrinomonadaceae bacterium]